MLGIYNVKKLKRNTAGSTCGTSNGTNREIKSALDAGDDGNGAIMAIRKKHVELLTLDQWEQFAGPVSPNHWQEGRSALELARAWLSGFPAELSAVLSAHANFGAVLEWIAEPEVELPFDGYRRPRQTDLLVRAKDCHGEFLIAVEGKADEPFDKLLEVILPEAHEKRLTNPRSRACDRVAGLIPALFHPKQKGEPTLSQMRYQLLTATAGALAEAKRQRISRVLFLIHEFHTSRTDEKSLARNAADLGTFLHRFSQGRFTCIKSGEILGPMQLPRNSPLISEAELFIGKVTRIVHQ